MKLLLFVMLLPFLCQPLTAISTEIDFELTDAQRYQLSQTASGTNPRDLHTPQNPVLLKPVSIYEDPELKTPAKTLDTTDDLAISTVILNQSGLPVYVLDSQFYMLADKTAFYEDVVLEETSLSETYWTRAIDVVYDSPFVKGSREVSRKPKNYSQVIVTARAQTHAGTYYQIDNYGWVKADLLSKQDTRVEAVQALLTKKYQKAHYGIYVKQLDTGLTAGINSSSTMYAASLAKLPILYYTQESLDQGKISKDTKFEYTSKVNDFAGAYDPSGSGSLPKKANQKAYSVDELMKKVAQQSDNVASNMLGYYVTDQFGQGYQSVISAASGQSWDMEARQMSPETIGNILEALYYQNGQVLDYLSQTDFDGERISKNIKEKVSHKIGDAYDFKHDAGIIYTSSPFILTIMTDKADYEDITEIADAIYEILK
ncbi:serine hydrolase [Streptococcus hyovaginalis]|uniref:serine hydrolase n=1 Tax=Streptococcus hyovaginalis TaxID=149015 RepID=UPI002A83E4EE|nr:serine hydrolase [Streptococcus hyovaginalis]MDY4510629.1 serine hydrolase [Streptococcus hyovaginalis]